jgi:ABC-2 type transport system ATP-binding protein
VATTLTLDCIEQGYRKRSVISDLSMSLRSDIVGLLGPNGSGKTTLLNTLATISPPRRGSMTFDGVQLGSEETVRAARAKIGYLPQNFGYLPGFTVYEFVRYCAWLRDVPKERADDETRQAIAAVDLEGRARAKMKSLSGGMLQRAGIASAIVGGPRLLLLDEPTAGLDPGQRYEFRELVRSLQTNRTIVLSTHLVEDVVATCTIVVVLIDGRIRFQGTPTELMAKETSGAVGDSPLERGYMSVLAAAGAGGTR